MFISTERKIEDLRKAKKERIEFEKYSKDVRKKLTDDECLKDGLVNFLNEVFSCRDAYKSILDVLKLGEELSLDKDEFCIDATRRWKFTVEYTCEEDSLRISICDKMKKGEGTFVECICPSKYSYGCKGKVYIKKRLFCKIKDKKIGDVARDAMAWVEDEYKEALRNLVFDFTIVNFYSCFENSLDKLIQEQEKRRL